MQAFVKVKFKGTLAKNWERLNSRIGESGSFTLQFWAPILWLVDAAWLLGQWVAGDRIGSCTRSTTDLFVLAGPTLAFKLAGIPQLFEDRRVAVDVLKRRLLDISGMN